MRGEIDWESLFALGQEEEQPVRRFTARFDSEGVCGHDIFEGEEAGYVGQEDEPTCGSCLDQL